MRTSEPVAISSIFTRIAKDGSYTYSAYFYQNILRYSLVLKRSHSNNRALSFTRWEITNWLTASDKDHVNQYIKNRIGRIKKTVNIKLKNLVQLQLLEVAGNKPIAKGSGTTPSYQFTEYGYLLAWIVESFDSNASQEVICNEIYNQLCNISTVDDNIFSTSTSIFISNFFKKCKERGAFNNIVILFRETLTMVDRSIVRMEDLVQRVLRLNFKDIERRTFFNNLFDETINELDLQTKKLVLYNLKLDIEKRMKEAVTDFKGFEKMRFRLKGFADSIALESYCIICDHYIAIELELLDYRRRTVESDLGIITVKCPLCGMDNSLQISAVL